MAIDSHYHQGNVVFLLIKLFTLSSNGWFFHLASCVEFAHILSPFSQRKNNHIFSLRCKDENVVPECLPIIPPLKTREGYRIAQRVNSALLRVGYDNPTE